MLVCEDAASISVRGGVPPYWAEWEYTDTLQIYYGLTVHQPLPGQYRVTVYDTLDCTLTLVVDVPADAPPCTRITGRVTYDKNQNCRADPTEMSSGCTIGMFVSRSLLRLVTVRQSGELLAYSPDDALCGFGQFGNSGIAPLRKVLQ